MKMDLINVCGKDSDLSLGFQMVAKRYSGKWF